MTCKICPYRFVEKLQICGRPVGMPGKNSAQPPQMPVETWETQGGHIEAGEQPLDAAKRELFEESGAVDFDIQPLCDYWAGEERNG